MSDPVRAELVEVLLVGFDRAGPGDELPRPVSQYWSKDGRLLAEFDHIFHSPDVPAYEVARLRAQVAQLGERLAGYESIPAQAHMGPPLAAIETAAGEVAHG